MSSPAAADPHAAAAAPIPATVSPALTEPSTRERFRGLLWLVAAAFFMQALDSTVVNTAVPAMAVALNVTPLGMRTALTSYVLTLAILIPASPWLCDRLGTRRVFGAAIVVFGLCSLLCGLAQTLPQLVAARVLQGIGCASLMPVVRYVLVRSIDKREFVRAMSTVATFGLLGSVLGPLLGGALVQFTSWRLIFLINVPVAIAGIWMNRRDMPEYRLPVVCRRLRAAADRFGTGRRHAGAVAAHRPVQRDRAGAGSDVCVAQPTHRVPGGRPGAAEGAQRLGGTGGWPVDAAWHLGHVPAAGAVPAGGLRLVAADGRPDDGAAGAGLDQRQVGDQPGAGALRLSSPAAGQYGDRGVAAGGVCPARPDHAGVGDRGTDILLWLFCRPAVHRDEHLDLPRPGYPARLDGFVDGLDRAIPRDELRHRAGHLADAGLAARARQRGLRRGISLDGAAAGPGHGRGESGVRTTPARSPCLIARSVDADTPAS